MTTLRLAKEYSPSLISLIQEYLSHRGPHLFHSSPHHLIILLTMIYGNHTAPPDDGGMSSGTTLTWRNVGLGFLFIVFDAVLSSIMGLKIGRNLIVAASRCIIQLLVMSLVLGKVFASNNPFAVAGIAFLLNVLGAIEATFNKAKRRFSNMASFSNSLFSKRH